MSQDKTTVNALGLDLLSGKLNAFYGQGQVRDEPLHNHKINCSMSLQIGFSDLLVR